MVVGTGEAAADAAAQLAKRGAGEIRIAARDPKEGAKLAAIVGGKPVSMAEIGLWIRKTDIVISATGSSNYILKTEDLEDAMKLRKNKPVSLIDIAVPRDIDPAVRGIGGVFLYDMDDLQNFVEKKPRHLAPQPRQGGGNGEKRESQIHIPARRAQGVSPHRGTQKKGARGRAGGNRQNIVKAGFT